MMVGATVCSGPRLAAAAVVAPTAAGGCCDCGWGLRGSCFCWRSLQLTAGGKCDHYCGWWSMRLRLLFLRLWLLRLAAELRLRLRLQWILPLVTDADAATTSGYSCFYGSQFRLLAADAVAAPVIATSGGHDCGSYCD